MVLKSCCCCPLRRGHTLLRESEYGKRLAVFKALSEGVKEECMDSDFDLATRAAQLEAILDERRRRHHYDR